MESVYSVDPNLKVEPALYSDGIPVFKPTMEEFKDFYKYNKAINKYGMESGIVKIIPPAEWLQLLQGTYTNDNLQNIRIKNPIVQNINPTGGYKGVYSSQNVERQRSFDIFQWKELAKKPNFVPPTSRRSRRLSLPGTPKSPGSAPSREAAAELLDGDFNVDAAEFTEQRCKELEEAYWRSLGYSEPMYGADMLGSLFLDEKTPWNVAHLPNVLDLMDESIPGVNDAYLYAGLWKATFSWHLEDQDLYSINYLHFGAPKQWYSISQKDSGRFYNLMKEIFDDEYRHCSEFLRHKLFMASPSFLAKHGIKCNSVVHNQGEFMITYPYGYHSGFNYGYNLAESVNFALDDWFEFAKNTRKCECISDSVGLNYKQIYCKFKGIPYVDDEAPESVQEPVKEPTLAPSKTAKRGRPRKNVSSGEKAVSAVAKDVSTAGKEGPVAKSRKIIHECALCPNNLHGNLRKMATFELLKADLAHVHRVCAERFPDQLTIRGKQVNGLLSISSAQKNLRCSVCHSNGPSKGTCFQCSYGKCTRSFHGTCALMAGVLLDSNACKMHRSALTPMHDCDDPDLFKKVSSFSPGVLIQFSFSRSSAKRPTGDVFTGILARNNPEEASVEMVVYPELKDTLEVRYADIIVDMNTNYSHGPRRASITPTSLQKPRRRMQAHVPLSDTVPRNFFTEAAKDEAIPMHNPSNHLNHGDSSPLSGF